MTDPEPPENVEPDPVPATGEAEEFSTEDHLPNYFEEFGVPDVEGRFEADYSPKEPEFGPNESALVWADRYLNSGHAPKIVREHIPLTLILLCAQIADRRNRDHPTHWYSPGNPFRYVIHLTLLGASGTGKGATVDQFKVLIGPTSNDPPLIPKFEWKGGSTESLRGGVPASQGGEGMVRQGSIERCRYGFIHIPEFTQLHAIGERNGGGGVQSILAWADTGLMSYETITGGLIDYASTAMLFVGLQLARLGEIEETVLGWNRRSVYDWFPPLTTDEMLPEKRPEAVVGNTDFLARFRETIQRAMVGWRPETVEWEDFRAWLSEAYKSQEAVIQDEQMLYAVAVGYHIASGGALSGNVRIGVSKDLQTILHQLIRQKALSRVPKDRRIAYDAMLVLEDPYVLGEQGRIRPKAEVVRIVAQRLSISEEEAQLGIQAISERVPSPLLGIAGENNVECWQLATKPPS